MKVDLDHFEMYYLLESCLRGSHLRSDIILRFVDDWYKLFTPDERECLYDWTLRLIYDSEFKPFNTACGADTIFMARYNPDNRYKVTMIDGQEVDAFLMDDKYYIKSNRYCEPKFIKKIEKI
jgi:hypothetical protein